MRRDASGPAATRPIASTRDMPWANEGEITTPLMRASSGASRKGWQCRCDCDSMTTASDTTCELRGWPVACGEYHARPLGWPSKA